MSLLKRVEEELRRTGVAASRFGREVAGDPRLVHDMRRGRQLGGKLRSRVESYMLARRCDVISLQPGVK